MPAFGLFITLAATVLSIGRGALYVSPSAGIRDRLRTAPAVASRCVGCEMARLELPQPLNTAAQDLLLDDAVRCSFERTGVEPTHNELELPAGRCESIERQREAWFHCEGGS